MKKFLLLALAAVTAGTLSAQIAVKKSEATVGKAMTKKQVMASQKQPAYVGKTVKMGNFSVAQAPAPFRLTKPMSLSGKQIVSMKTDLAKKAPAVKAIQARKAAAFATSYTGTAVSNQGAVNWTARPGVFTYEGQDYNAIYDLFENPFTAAGLEETMVLYGIEEGKIFVPAQYITTLSFRNDDGTTESFDVYVSNFSASSTDGSMTLTLDDDGTLTIGADTPYVAYVLMPQDYDKEFSFDDMDSYWTYYQNIRYLAAGKEAAPQVSYNIDEAVFYSGLTDDGYSFTYQHVMYPAYAPVHFNNLTTDVADSWSWSISTIDYDEAANDGEGGFFRDKEVATGSERDFEFTTEGGELYASPVLTGKLGDLESEPFEGADEGALVYAGGLGDEWEFEDGRAPIKTRANLKYGLTGVTTASDESNYKTIIFYQGKPTAPLYIEGVNMLLYNFNQGEDFHLTCKLQKVQRSATGYLNLGEVIAESEVTAEDIVPSDWSSTAQINFDNFVVKDDMGFSVALDYLFIEDEFCVVIEGWNNGTFTGMAIGDEGPAGGIATIGLVRADQDEYTGYYFQYPGYTFIGFNGLVYGYLYTEDDTTVALPSAGGQAAIHIQPMLRSVNADGSYATRLFLDADSDEIPDWLTVGFANEVYTDSESEFDLVFQAEALPAGTESREATITFMQEGAKLTVTVKQSDAAAGISNVSVKTTSVKPFDLSGRVSTAKTGLVVRNGKKYFVK